MYMQSNIQIAGAERHSSLNEMNSFRLTATWGAVYIIDGPLGPAGTYLDDGYSVPKVKQTLIVAILSQVRKDRHREYHGLKGSFCYRAVQCTP